MSEVNFVEAKGQAQMFYERVITACNAADPEILKEAYTYIRPTAVFVSESPSDFRIIGPDDKQGIEFSYKGKLYSLSCDSEFCTNVFSDKCLLWKLTTVEGQCDTMLQWFYGATEVRKRYQEYLDGITSMQELEGYIYNLVKDYLLI